MNNHAHLVSFGSEYIRFQRELNESTGFVSDLLLDLISNMLYWNSSWSPAISSQEIMLERWDISYPEYNNLANDVFRIHSTLERLFSDIDDRNWGIFNADVILQSGEYFDLMVRKLGDYRIEQWNSDHGKELCADGALRESARGSRWRSRNHTTTKKGAAKHLRTVR